MVLENVRVGLMVGGAMPEALRAAAEAARAAGVRHCQLMLRVSDLTPDALRSAGDILNRAGLENVATSCYLNPLDPNNGAFMGYDGAALASMAQHADALGARAFTTWSGGYGRVWSDADERNASAEALHVLVQAARSLLALLDQCEGQILFEPFHRHILGSPERCRAFFDLANEPRLQLVMDPPNFVPDGQIDSLPTLMNRAFDLLGDRVGLAHLKDISQGPDRRVGYPGPGDGVMDYPVYLRRLRNLNRPVDAIIEHVSPDEYAKAVAFVREQWEQAT
ncbi:MAG: sugar phosphate isomerase/epimerase [Armatimonadetes bacterium]|nr:sugar phosphate isomerase/epimerase [Armatimonadota bacterium]